MKHGLDLQRIESADWFVIVLLRKMSEMSVRELVTFGVVLSFTRPTG